MSKHLLYHSQVCAMFYQMFMGKVPSYGTKLTPGATATAKEHFSPVTHADIMAHLRGLEQDFTATATDCRLMVGRFEKEGRELYFVQNHTRDKDVDVLFRHKSKTTATVYDPTNGSIVPITMGESFRIPWFRSVLVWFD